MPSVFTYLGNLMLHCVSTSQQLNELLKGQQLIMATLADVQARLDAQTAKVAEIGPALVTMSDGIANVAADIQALKDQIGAGTPGITPEEADAVVAGLDSNLSQLSSAVAGIQSVAANLQAVADAQ